MNAINLYRNFRFAAATCILALLVSAAGCKPRHNTPEVHCPVVRLDKIVAGVAHADSASYIAKIDSVRPELDAMMAVLGYKSPDWHMLKIWSESPVVTVFQPDVDSVFTSLSTLESDLGYIMLRATEEAVGLPQMTFATVVWGSQRPLVRVDSIMLIALNHYLGASYPGYEGFNAVKRTEKTPQMLPYDIAAVLCATQHPMHTSAQPTLLAWMLYEGALIEARMRLVPDAQENMALGYSREQMELLKDNTKNIWQEMAAMKLLYDTDQMTIDRYLTPAPSTPLLQGNAPGRVGRYIGYRLVKAYLKKHPDTSLVHLLSPAFYDNNEALADIKL